ncbi:MAG TPA: DUF2752 domain-containing protein [Sphingobacteriaceae bacterium]
MRSRIPVEVICWCSALILLYFLVPPFKGHFSLCPLSILDFPCPGCGLGRSLHYFLHGEIRASIQMHWFGIPAFFILGYRILQLLRNFVLTLKET